MTEEEGGIYVLPEEFVILELTPENLKKVDEYFKKIPEERRGMLLEILNILRFLHYHKKVILTLEP